MRVSPSRKLHVPSPSIYTAEEKRYLIYKRLIDLFLAVVGLILLSPLFLIVAFLIKGEDPKGSILFKQIRVGENGKTFYMYKFRSMVANAEDRLYELLDYNEAEGALFKMKEDPRVTKIGRFIRRTSIDEFPQLWNVLKGEMSIVGPRPPLEREIVEYTEHDLQRLTVIPGCTGLWQVSGRSSLGFSEMVALDLKYIQTRSLGIDFKIICKTFMVLFRSDNAY
nr:sugar transferase [Alkalihalobacillus sp. CinArs1]